MAEQKRIVKSPVKAIALSLAGIVVLLGAAGGVQLFLAYEMSLCEGVLSFGLHFLALAAMVFGGWGAVKAIRG